MSTWANFKAANLRKTSGIGARSNLSQKLGASKKLACDIWS